MRKKFKFDACTVPVETDSTHQKHRGNLLWLADNETSGEGGFVKWCRLISLWFSEFIKLYHASFLYVLYISFKYVFDFFEMMKVKW